MPQHAPSQRYRFKSSEGYLIYAGKNNRQNDLLVKTAASDDIWLHAKTFLPLRILLSPAPKEPFKHDVVRSRCDSRCAQQEAKYGAKVQVDYTQRKNVRKPGGAHPGMVIYEKHTSLLASPDKALLETLEKEQ